jgi:CheY-like chemotaxis protein
VESEIGVGSKFYVYLPVAQGKSNKSKSSEIRSNGGIGKVLVMDDERLVRELAGEILNHLKYETEFASDGHEAIEAYKRAKENGKPFDVVIMDLTVPGGMGGREAIKRMLEFDPSVKAIVSSGYSNDPVISDYKKFGFRGVICKPYKMEELTEALNRVLHEDD